MSNIINSSLKCPKCGHSPIMEFDTGHNSPDYTYGCKCGFTTENMDDFIVVEDSQPSPPTPRPDVEAAQKYVKTVYEIRSIGMRRSRGRVYLDRILPLILPICDYALDVEKRLETVDSLVADLVEAVRRYRPDMDTINYHNNHACHEEGAECACSWEELTTALTAAKQYRESGEEGKS